METKSLEQLQAETIPHATTESVGIELKGPSQEGNKMRAIFDAYFMDFVSPPCVKGDLLGDHHCIACGGILDGILGTFEWSMVNGEGQCSQCHYPCRAIHRIPDDDESDEPLATLTNFILQYHPQSLMGKTLP